MKHMWLCVALLVASTWIAEAAESSEGEAQQSEEELEQFMKDARERARKEGQEEEMPEVDVEDIAPDMDAVVVPRRSVFNFTAGGGFMSGHTTYQIGGRVTEPGWSYDVHFPISELEFPLDVAVLKFGAGACIRERWLVSFSAAANVTEDPGNMIDRDWITEWAPNRLDIYSESDSELTAFMGDVDVVYVFHTRDGLTLGAGVGLMLEQFEYECRLIRQWSPSGLFGFGYMGDGSVGITYDISYVIPYAAVRADLAIGRSLTCSAEVGFSPFAMAEDEDVHLLRNPPKKSVGDYDGYAFLVSAEGTFHFTDSWFVRGELDFLTISVDGEQESSQRGVYTHTIDAEVESQQLSILAMAGFSF